jgi:hypothetical protein
LRDLGVVPPEQYRRLRINYSARQWSKAEPYDDEIAIEEPSLLVNAIRLMIEEKIQTMDQIGVAIGFSREWLGLLLNVPKDLDAPNLQPKLIEMKRRA